MKQILAIVLAIFLVYLVYDTFLKGKVTPAVSRGRLCDYSASGSVYQDIPTALKKGIRLLEVHVYSDEQDQPVVATHPQNEGHDFASENISFEQVCIDIENDAFPSKDPCILSIVSHTTKSVTLNKVAEHLQTITRKHLIPDTDIQEKPIDELANKLIIVSGGAIQGTALESLINLNWSKHGLRRLTYQQALHPRDPEELKRFNQDFITIVAPEPELKTIYANPNQPLAYGCQWNLFRSSPPGFVAKTLLVE